MGIGGRWTYKVITILNLFFLLTEIGYARDVASQTESDRFMEIEKQSEIGSDIELNQQELIANQFIMDAKKEELESNETQSNYEHSKVFQYLRQMPKGAVLHAFDMAMCSIDFLMNLTYIRENDLWVCTQRNQLEIIKLKILRHEPEELADPCVWTSMWQLRRKFGVHAVEQHLRHLLTVGSSKKWENFSATFKLLEGFLFFVDNYKDCFMKALNEFYADGVQHIEFRTFLPSLYFADGVKIHNFHTAYYHRFIANMFKESHPDFINVKSIYCPHLSLNPIGMTEIIETTTMLKEDFPDIFGGFEIDNSGLLNESVSELKERLNRAVGPIPINFHVNYMDRNVSGPSSDTNLCDAVLMGMKRIWDGSPLITHPMLADVVRKNDTVIEISPFSKLQFIDDYRYHPWRHFFVNNIPVVISSDYPALWNITPSTHDFYVAFMKIASPESDLRLLKQLALNSIKYSSMSEEEKTRALVQWQTNWNAYIGQFENGVESFLLEDVHSFLFQLMIDIIELIFFNGE